MFRQRQPPTALPQPPEEKVAAGRKTTWLLRGLLAASTSFFLVLMFTKNFVYSQGIYGFATSFQTISSIKNQVPSKDEYTITCNITTTTITTTCPTNYSPESLPSPKHENTSEPRPTCPEYFKWIHEDLKPWKKNGITREMIDDIARFKKFRRFRLIIVNGTAYVRSYGNAYQTRDTFTLWGVLQLLKLYPGKVPDLDLMFQIEDKTSIKKDEYEEGKAPPLFHYCGSNDTYDIVFPDWSYWGWPDTNIKPWVSLKKDLDEGNKMMKWVDREPFAFWRGNLFMGERKKLRKCNSTKDWNTLIYQQDWKREIEEGFKNSDLSKQCTHRYKIYMEGKAWSVSRKYILACDSMTLLVNPFYYDFYTRDFVPLKHYWPIDPDNICNSIKSAVDWGNQNPNKAEEIGKETSKFIQENMTMQKIYDYMFHVLVEYSKLLRYKPTVPHGAVELCSEFWVCPRSELEHAFKVEAAELRPSMEAPCALPPPFEDSEMEALEQEVSAGFVKARAWEESGKPIV